jgi:hypothetical protein
MGSVGAVPHPGLNAAGVPPTTGPNAAGAESAPLVGKPDEEVDASLIKMAQHPTAQVGSAFFAQQGLVSTTLDGSMAEGQLAARGIPVVYDEPQ